MSIFQNLNTAVHQIPPDDPRIGNAEAIRFHRNDGTKTYQVTFTFPEGTPVTADDLNYEEVVLAGVLIGSLGYQGAVEPETNDFVWVKPANA